MAPDGLSVAVFPGHKAPSAVFVKFKVKLGLKPTDLLILAEQEPLLPKMVYVFTEL